MMSEITTYDSTNIRNRLADLRNNIVIDGKKGLTQDELAKKMQKLGEELKMSEKDYENLTGKMISSLENYGKKNKVFTVPLLVLYSRLFDKTTDYILFGEEPSGNADISEDSEKSILFKGEMEIGEESYSISGKIRSNIVKIPEKEGIQTIRDAL